MRLAHAACLVWLSIGLIGASPSVPVDPSKPREQPAEFASDTPTVEELIETGGELMDMRHYDEAIQAYSLALQVEPNNGHAHANRALAYGWTNRLDQARADLAAAERVIPDHAVINRIRALMAMRQSDDDTAVAELSKSLKKEPGNPFGLNFRAWIYQRRGLEAEAIADANAYIRAKPDDPDAYVLKADLLRAQSKQELAAKEAERLTKLFSSSAYAASSAARIYDALGDRLRALQEIDRAIAIDPDLFYYYKLKAQFRHWTDVAGRRKDLNSAFALLPSDLGVITQLGLLDFQQHRWADAITRFSMILNSEWRDFGVLAYRSMARLNAGDKALGTKDFEAALAAASGADDFDLICHSFAFEGVALDWALQSCNRAIQLDERDDAYRSNRGLVYLRLGQLDAALADYDFAIAADKRRASSYYGRALVRWRQGDKPGALADLQKARVLDAKIDESFRQHGLTDLPTP